MLGAHGLWAGRDLYRLFVCFESHKQFFSYLVTVTITGDGAANLDPCLALTAFSSEGSLTCHTYCDTGPPFLRSHPKDPWFYLLNAVLVAKEQSLPILNVLGLTRPARAGLDLSCHTCCDTGPRFFRSHPKHRPHSVAFYDTQWDVEDLF
jgi:hypothetical protein